MMAAIVLSFAVIAVIAVIVVVAVGLFYEQPTHLAAERSPKPVQSSHAADEEKRTADEPERQRLAAAAEQQRMAAEAAKKAQIAGALREADAALAAKNFVLARQKYQAVFALDGSIAGNMVGLVKVKEAEDAEQTRLAMEPHSVERWGAVMPCASHPPPRCARPGRHGSAVPTSASQRATGRCGIGLCGAGSVLESRFFQRQSA